MACGSIYAAAYDGSAAVRAVYRAVTADVTVQDADVRRYWEATASDPKPQSWTLRYRRDGAPPCTLANTYVSSLPKALAAALSAAVPGDTVRARDALGLHEATVLQVAPAADPCYLDDAPAVRAHLLKAARFSAFARWLDRARAARVALVPDFEHPGDPGQPDNHHRH